MRIRRNPLRMLGLSFCAAMPEQLRAPPAEAAVLRPPSPAPAPAPPASAHVDIHTAQLVLPAAAPTEVCLQSCAWTHPHTLNPENLNDGLIGDAWREPRENPGLASENVNIVFLLKRKKVEDNIREQEQQQEEEVNEKLKRDGSNTQQKKDCSSKKMMAKAIKKEEEEEVNKKLKRDGSIQQKKGRSNKKMTPKVIKEEEEEEVNKKLKRDGSSQQKKGCSNKKMMAKVKEEEEVNKKLKRDGCGQQKKSCSNKKIIKEEVATAHKPRCKRSDGRTWRCRERAALPHTLCEDHWHKSRSSYNKRKEARLQKASAISSEADPWKASSSSSKRARTSASSSSSFSTGAAALMSDAPESSKAAPPPPSPTGARSSSKQQRKKKKGDNYSGGAFHYPEPFGPFRGKQRGNYGSPNRVEASIASGHEALEDEALEGMMMLGSKVVTG